MSKNSFWNSINENENLKSVIPKLLTDKTTRKNIVFATDSYTSYGENLKMENQMYPMDCITLIEKGIMLPRILKSKELQEERTRNKAEVFTPSWVCNKMNNYCDEQWFNRKNVFNTENEDNTWTRNKEKIDFNDKENKKWKKYVDSKRIEITCGEAPYLVSRYDAATGKKLEIEDRIGILDRKLRVVNENTNTEEEWIKWTIRAYQSVYGYEFQGDNLFFARINLVQTFIDYYTDKFQKQPSKEILEKIGSIVSWNIWQMDGLNYTVPFKARNNFEQLSFESLFNASTENKQTNKEPIYCKIMDWRANRSYQYIDLKRK